MFRQIQTPKGFSLFAVCLWEVSRCFCSFFMKIINASSQPHPKAKESSLRRQPTFRGVTKGFPSKWRLRNECRNSLLMTCHYPGLLKVFDWLKQVSIASRPIRSTAQIWVVTRHHYWIFAFLPQTSFCGKTSGGVAKCRLFSQGTKTLTWQGRLFDSVGPGGVDYADIEKIARLFLIFNQLWVFVFVIRGS